MKPQLLLAILAVIMHCVMSQPMPQLHRYFSSSDCSDESLVAQIQVAILPDGCSNVNCEQSGNFWVNVTCNDALNIIDGFSYLSTYTGSDCNDTLLDERIIFASNTTTACLNVVSAGYSILINNTCTSDSNIFVERHTSTNCDPNAIISTYTSSNGTCNTNVYAFCSVIPSEVPIGSDPIAAPESTPSTSTPANGPSNSGTPNSSTPSNNNSTPKSTPKASGAMKVVASTLLFMLVSLLW